MLCFDKEAGVYHLCYTLFENLMRSYAITFLDSSFEFNIIMLWYCVHHVFLKKKMKNLIHSYKYVRYFFVKNICIGNEIQRSIFPKFT